MNSLNPFDNLGLGAGTDEDLKASFERLDYLIHQTFKQTESGAELLEKWTDVLLKAPSAEPGMDQLSIGLVEGKKGFIRNILLTIEKVEGSTNDR